VTGFELIGRIVEIKPGSRKAGKGPPKRYVFINFGSSRRNIVKISIWSDGLAKLKEEPSTAWIGRWVSVTGLMDVPYENKRYGHKHLSITVAGRRPDSAAQRNGSRVPTGQHLYGTAAPRSRCCARRCIRETGDRPSGCRRGEAEEVCGRAARASLAAISPPAGESQLPPRSPFIKGRNRRVACWLESRGGYG